MLGPVQGCLIEFIIGNRLRLVQIKNFRGHQSSLISIKYKTNSVGTIQAQEIPDFPDIIL